MTTPRIEPILSARIPRRSFLALGLGAVAWACSNGGPRGADGESAAPGDDDFSVVSTAREGLAVGDTRQGFAIFKGQRPVAVRDVKIRLAKPGGEPFEVTPEPVKITRGPGGEGHKHTEDSTVDNIYVIRHDFDTPGVWETEVTFDGGSGHEVFQILEEVASPMVGKKAIASKSPTFDDPGGVDPVCTRTPKCSMHELSIADALDAGKPFVIVFGTPRYCTSRTCGPVVDFVERASKTFKDEASFVHVEMWKNDDAVNKADGFVPAFEEWKFTTEPWLYFIGADGKVRDRWLGAVGPEEVAKAVSGLVST